MAVINTLPSKGWEYREMIDLGDLCGVCQNCGTEIRYEHRIWHEEVGEIGVGCICCDYLTQNYKASTNEAKHKRDMSRVRTLLNSPRWVVRKNGHFIHYRGYKIIVWDNGDKGYCLQIQRSNEFNGRWYYVHRSYHNDFNKAVIAAYNYIVK